MDKGVRKVPYRASILHPTLVGWVEGKECCRNLGFSSVCVYVHVEHCRTRRVDRQIVFRIPASRVSTRDNFLTSVSL